MAIFTDLEVMQIMGRADSLELRAEAAEDRAAQLEAERDSYAGSAERLAETIETLRAEVGTAWKQIEQIRQLIDAYPEHDVIEAVRRFAGLLQHVQAERDEQKQRADILDGACEKALNERDELTTKLADSEYRRLEEMAERDELARKLEQMSRATCPRCALEFQVTP